MEEERRDSNNGLHHGSFLQPPLFPGTNKGSVSGSMGTGDGAAALLSSQAFFCRVVFSPASYLSFAPDLRVEGMQRSLSFAVKRYSKALAKGHCLVARPGAPCHWIMLMVVTCNCFLPMGRSLWSAAFPQGSLPRVSVFPNTFRNKGTPGSLRTSERRD